MILISAASSRGSQLPAATAQRCCAGIQRMGWYNGWPVLAGECWDTRVTVVQKGTSRHHATEQGLQQGLALTWVVWNAPMWQSELQYQMKA